jgi:hypothetical protein
VLNCNKIGPAVPLLQLRTVSVLKCNRGGHGRGMLQLCTPSAAGPAASPYPTQLTFVYIRARSIRRAMPCAHSPPNARTFAALAAWSYATRRCSTLPSSAIIA